MFNAGNEMEFRRKLLLAAGWFTNDDKCETSCIDEPGVDVVVGDDGDLCHCFLLILFNEKNVFVSTHASSRMDSLNSPLSK